MRGVITPAGHGETLEAEWDVASGPLHVFAGPEAELASTLELMGSCGSRRKEAVLEAYLEVWMHFISIPLCLATVRLKGQGQDAWEYVRDVRCGAGPQPG